MIIVHRFKKLIKTFVSFVCKTSLAMDCLTFFWTHFVELQ